MLMFVLNQHFQRECIIDTDSMEQNQFNFNTEKQTYTITDGVLLSTFTATFNKNYPEAEYLVVGNYIAFKDEWDKTWCFLINEITNETTYTREIYCEDLGLDLLNSASLTYPSNSPQRIDYYLNRELNDSGWEIGVNEIKTKKELSFDTSSTTLKRIQDIATAFECEIDFEIKFNANQLVEQKINIRKHIGVENPVARLQTEQDITEIKRTISIKELKTACYALGANDTGIEKLSYNDGKYVSNYGSNLVISQEASEQFSRFAHKSKGNRGYLEMVNTSESSEANQILADAIKALSEVDKPKINYEANVLFQFDQSINIGDTVQLIDFYFQPKLLLEARVTGFEISRTRPSENKITISNFKEKEDGISKLIKDFQNSHNRLDKIEQHQVSVTIDEEQNGSERKMVARVWLGNKDITDEFSDQDFTWIKTDITGREDVNFRMKYKNVGNVITVDLNEIDRTSTITCSVIYHQFLYVSKPWFQKGLKTLATKVHNEKEEGDLAIIFASDVHHANQTFVRPSADILSKAEDHLKNVLELTKMCDIDAVILGGDNADGSSLKKFQLENLKKVSNIMDTVEVPTIIAKGNHDDNSWYAYKVSNGNPSLDNIITPKELTPILTQPSRKFKNIEIKDLYYCMDIGDTRHIVLNSQDIPYTLNEQGRVRFVSIYTTGYSDEQLKWFVNKLETAGNKRICIYQHVNFKDGFRKDNFGKMNDYNNDVVLGIINAYQNRKVYSSYKSKDFTHFPYDIYADFTKAKGKIIYCMSGHNHDDYITKKSNINFINTGCSAPIKRSGHGGTPLGTRKFNTLEEDLFDVVIIKKKENKVKMFRFGAGEDREVSY